MWKIIKVKNDTHDVFGPEWKNWCRLKIGEENRVFFVKGDRFDKKTFNEIRSQLINATTLEKK